MAVAGDGCLLACLGRKEARSGALKAYCFSSFEGLVGQAWETRHLQGSLEVSTFSTGMASTHRDIPESQCSINLSEHSQAKLNLKATWMEGCGVFLRPSVS